MSTSACPPYFLLYSYHFLSLIVEMSIWPPAAPPNSCCPRKGLFPLYLKRSLVFIVPISTSTGAWKSGMSWEKWETSSRDIALYTYLICFITKTIILNKHALVKVPCLLPVPQCDTRSAVVSFHMEFFWILHHLLHLHTGRTAAEEAPLNTQILQFVNRYSN